MPESLTRNPSCSPQPNLPGRFHLSFKPARQVETFDSVKGFCPISLFRARKAPWKIVPDQQFRFDLPEAHTGLHPTQPEFIIFWKISGLVSPVQVQQLAPKHNAGMRYWRFHETAQGHV